MQEKANCVFCGAKIQENNIGIMLLGNHICNVCEEKITTLAWNDPDYETYKSGLKKIWCFKEA